MEPVVLFTTLGPNPAPLTELLWALARHQQQLVVEAHVVVAQRGALYLERELLTPGGPLDQLVALLGEDLAHGPRLHIHRARLHDGSPLVDDEDPAHADAYQATVWNAAVAARQAAGDRPLVFALAAGRRRTMMALLTMAYQMLARPQDACLDIRVDDPRAEGGSGFFFPDQTPPRIVGRRGEFDAREVEVRLVPVSLPRLGRLIGQGDLASAAKALAATQQAVDRAALPALRVDLAQGACFVDERRLPLGASLFLWYATLAIERHQGGEGWTHADSQFQRKLLRGSPAPVWRDLEALPTLFKHIAQNKPIASSLRKDASLRVLRTKTREVLRSFCREHIPLHEHLLVPAIKNLAGGVRQQRIELPADRIELHDPHGWVSEPGR